MPSFAGSAADSPSPTAQPSWVRFGMLTLLCLAASVAYLCRNSIGVAESTIRQELKLSEDAMGWVMSSFFLAYALAQIPTGWLGSRIGSRTAIPFFAIAWSGATAMMSLAFGMPFLLASRLGNGVAQAGLFPACTMTIGKWFPQYGRGLANGSLASFMSIGGAIGVFITGHLVGGIGWRSTFTLYGVVGLVFAVFFFLIFRNDPDDHPWTNEAERELIASGKVASKQSASPENTPWLALLLSPPTWWICGQQFCRAAGQIFFSSWFATYLQETRGVTVQSSGMLNSLPLIGIVLGAFLGGGLSDEVLKRTGSKRLARSGVAAGSMLACALFVMMAYFIEDPLLAVLTISLGTFAASVGGPCAYTVTIDMGAKHVAVLFATMNMVGNLGAFAFIRTVPAITERAGWSEVLAVFGLLYLGAAAFWLLLKPDGNVFDQSFYRDQNRSVDATKS